MAGIVLNAEILESRLRFLLKRLTAAQKEFGLFDAGDRILIAVSGGKDSITLCHLLAVWNRIQAPELEIAALHAQPLGAEGNEEGREQIRAHLNSLHIPVHFAEMDFSEFYSGKETHNCFRCAWKRRKELFIFAVEHGFNKVAFGHHLDDAVETSLMNLLYHANLETMEPKRDFFDGQVTLVRPLILAEEREIKRVSSRIDFPFYGCLCPADHESVRDEVKEYLRSFGRHSRMIKRNIWAAACKWTGKVNSAHMGN